MVNPIPNSIDKLWEQWNIRGVILFSLFLQIFLVICSPLRKRMQNVLLLFSIWSAYLIADVAANFCVGLIASNQDPSSQSIISTHSDLLAFWAPFLLVHLGGPDTITAFSLEDNQLWLRHMLGFIIQFISCAYVFLLTVPRNKLWIPTVLVFVAGMIKYAERTYALYLGSKYPGDAEQVYIPNKAVNVSGIDEIPKDGDVEKLSQVGVVLVADRFCYQSDKQTNQIIEPKLFNRISAQDALRVIDTELNFHYEGCYTKFWALCRTSGCLSQFVAIACHFAAFGLFFSEDKHKQGFDAFDVKVTYALLFGAMALDTIALLMLLFSDRAIVYFHQHDVGGFFNILKAFHELIKRQKWSKCKKKPYTKFTELSTWVPFRRWKGSISGFNMISYCRFKNKFFVPKDSFSYIFIWLYEAKNPFLLELWEFIFSVLKRKSEEAINYDATLLLRRSVGDWSLNLIGEEERRKNLKPYVIMPPYRLSGNAINPSETVIVWHIATHLCYVLDRHYQVDEREFSKLLSDYMIYLVLYHGHTAHVTPLQGTLEELMKKKFFISDEDEVEACEKLLTVKLEANNRILYHACILAKELGMISQVDIKWKFISQVWVELLSYASDFDLLSDTGLSSFYLQYSSNRGGELISRVWLLMTRLGLGQQGDDEDKVLRDREELKGQLLMKTEAIGS